MSIALSGLLVSALTATASAATSPAAARFAIVIGNNYALPGSGYDTLSFADDDAMRFAQFFQDTGVRTHLLAAPDPDTAPERGRRSPCAGRRPDPTGLAQR